MTPGVFTPSGTTPVGAKAMGMATPNQGQLSAMTPEQRQAFSWQVELDERNRPITEDELDAILPGGYKVGSRRDY